MNTNDFVSINQLLSEILVFCNDENLRHGQTKGFYQLQLRNAIDELSIDTFFDERTVDLPLDPELLQLDMPSNMFNIREIYLWRGDCCSPETSVKVWWKRLFNNKWGGTNYTANQKENGKMQHDPFLKPSFDSNTRSTANLFYANFQNGLVMFSANSAAYPNVRFVGNGFGGEINELPIVPRFLREAVVDFVVEKILFARKKRSKEDRADWMDAYNKLTKPYDGSWAKAQHRISSLNTWERESIKEYLGKYDL